MNEILISNYNSLVKPDDFVIHLGDLFCGVRSTHSAKSILNRLNGRKILLRGNHDTFSNYFYEEFFEKIGEYLIINEYFLCHYPLFKTQYNTKQERNLLKIFKDSDCSKIIHGHTHNNPISFTDNIPRINTSVEVNEYKPILMNF